MSYPKKMVVMVNTLDEEKKVRALGAKMENEDDYQEFPKVLYLHPSNTAITVQNAKEKDEFLGKGYQLKPFVPKDDSFDTSPKPAATIPPTAPVVPTPAPVTPVKP